MADKNLTLALKIKADLGATLADIKSLEGELQRTGRASQQINRAPQARARGGGKHGKHAHKATSKLGKTRAGVESISKQLDRLQKIGGAALFGKLFAGGLAGLANVADEYNSYQSRIRLVSKSNDEASQTFKQLMQVANDTGQLFGATAELYTRVYRSLGDTADPAKILNFTKTVQQALVVSGAGAQEAQAAIVQLAQGLAAGALRGDEFNSVAEQAPIILEVLQKHLGKTRAELRKMAEQGQLTAEVIMQAVAASSEEIEKQYSQMPKTIGRSINELSNAWMQFIGATDNTLSASSIVSSGISTLASNFNLLAGAALIVAAAIGVRLVSAYGAKLVAMGKLTAMTLWFNRTLTARATIEAKAAQAALVMARNTEAEAAATARLAAANEVLKIAEVGRGASLGKGIGSGLLALTGGPVGLAITALLGLVAAYQHIKDQEEQLEQAYQQSAKSIEENIAKTEALLEARRNLGEFGGFDDRLIQADNNTKAIEEAIAALDKLRERKKLLEGILLASDTDIWGQGKELDEVNAKIADLENNLKRLTETSGELSQDIAEQYRRAFDAAIESGGELADKLKAIGGPDVAEAQELLRKEINKNQAELVAMQDELGKLETKLRTDISNASLTAIERLEQFRDRAIDAAKKAGNAGSFLDPFIAKLETVIGLQKELEQIKQDKDNDKYLDNLRERQATQNMTTAQKIKHDNRKKGLTGDKLAEADALADQIQAGEKKGKTAKTGRTAKAKEYDAASKNQQLNIQYLRLTGQAVKANLTDIQGRYNQLLAEFTKHSNVDGINLIKKILPLEEAKVQVDGIQAEINKLFSNQSAQEQRIQAQVQTGLITHLEGQRQLKEVYTQTVAEIEKQIPLLEKLAQMPGAQGEQARAMLDQMKIKIGELKNAGNDLEKAFKDGLTQGIQTSLVGLANGTMTLKDAIKNLATTIVNSMAQIASQQLAMQASSAISGWFGAAAGAASGAVTAATGGYISGPGTGTSDSIPARLSNGEYVVRAAMVSHYGVGFLHALNRGQLRKFSTGGLVSQPPVPSYREPGLSDKLRNGQAGINVSAPPVSIQQTLAVDSAELFTAGINTTAGSRAVMTLIRANKQTIKQDLGV